MITIENKPKVYPSLAGDNLTDFIKECINFCKIHKCEVDASFNGITHTITAFIDNEKLFKNWFP